MSLDETSLLLTSWLGNPTSDELGAIRALLTASHPDLFRPPETATPDTFIRRAWEDLIHRNQLPATVTGPELSAACQPGGWLAERATRVAFVYDQVRLHQLSLELGRRWTACMVRVMGFLFGRYFGNVTRSRDMLDEAFCRAIQGAGGFDPRLRFCPWFMSILTNAANEKSKTSAEFSKMTEVSGDTHATFPHLQRPSPLTDAERLQLFLAEGIEVTPELLRLTAEESLNRRGVTTPSATQLDRERRRLERTWKSLLGTKPDPNRVNGRLSELYAGYGHHRDFVRELPEGAAARTVLEKLTPLIEDLLHRQERIEWKQTPPPGSVPILATIQVQGWSLAESGEERLQGAVHNIRWLSWRWDGLALLAACRRYAERVNQPALAPFIRALDAGNWLNNIPPGDRTALAAHLPVVCPNGVPVDCADGAGVILAVSVCTTTWHNTIGRRISRRQVSALAAELPDRDFNWWLSRVTGRARERADADTRELFARI